jgi:hypothetical protein
MGCCQIVHGLRASGISDHSYLKRTLNRIEKPPSKETANPRAEARHQPSKGACASKVAGGTFMRHLQSVLAMLVATVLIGCGAGHANLTSITVSPQSATTTSSPQGQVGYTASGNFANGKSRELSQVDGLSWKTAQTSTGTVAATIGSTGEVTCSAPGTVTITASAPENLSFTLNNGVQNTSMTVSGTAMLICQ